MATFIWRRARSGSTLSRIFSAYLALVLAIAVAGPGLAVYAAEGDAPEAPPLEEALPVEVALEPQVEEPVIEVPVAEEPVIEEPVAEEPVAEEPVVEEPVAEEPASAPAVVASAEEPVEPSREIATTVAPLVVAAIAPLKAGARPICEGGVKLDGDPRSGTYTISTSNVEVTPTTPTDFEITITTYDNGAGMMFDFTSNYPVGHVGVKGGNTGYNDYYYDPPVYSGTGLHAPVNPSGKYADISHIIFCFGETDEPDVGDLTVYKYEDLNGNGEYDDGEPMLEDWAFALTDAQGQPVDSGLTDEFGQLTFYSLDPGEYTATETLQDGWTNTTPLAQSETVVVGETAELWFGNQRIPDEPEGDLIVYKYEDLNGNGEYDDGEPMLEDWAFILTQETPPIAEGIGAAAIWIVDSGLTDEDGELYFGPLTPGEYTATETLQDGWTNTTPLAQTATVVDGQTAELWFGNQRIPDEPEGDLIVYKFHDLNENGEYDDGEPMLEGWEFTLESAPVIAEGPIMAIIRAALALDSGLTDVDGELYFGPLTPGEYIVTETLQDGWTNTTLLSQSVTVVDGQTAELWFGNVPTIDEPEEGDLIVYKFHDLNENGVFDAGEPMLEGWEFVLSADGSAVASGMTDSSGELLFSGLEPGAYTVTETLEDGWFNTTPLTQAVTVVAGETASLWFGNADEFLPFTELDLAITKAVDKPTAKPGDLLTYTLTYWNTGDLVAYNFTIVDDYDEAHLTVVDAAGGTVAGGKITWQLPGPLAREDGKQTITYTMRVKASMPEGTTNVRNTVVIDHPLDADPTNNTDDALVIVRVPAEEEPFLPFTGGEYMLLIVVAAAAATLGTLLRFRRHPAA
jgi:uncharacterized repeat protein (TIGR01451 family)